VSFVEKIHKNGIKYRIPRRLIRGGHLPLGTQRLTLDAIKDWALTQTAASNLMVAVVEALDHY